MTTPNHEYGPPVPTMNMVSGFIQQAKLENADKDPTPNNDLPTIKTFGEKIQWIAKYSKLKGIKMNEEVKELKDSMENYFETIINGRIKFKISMARIEHFTDAGKKSPPSMDDKEFESKAYRESFIKEDEGLITLDFRNDSAGSSRNNSSSHSMIDKTSSMSKFLVPNGPNKNKPNNCCTLQINGDHSIGVRNSLSYATNDLVVYDLEMNILHAAILAQREDIVLAILDICSEKMKCEIDIDEETEFVTDPNEIKNTRKDIFRKLLNGKTNIAGMQRKPSNQIRRIDQNLNGMNLLHCAIQFFPEVFPRLLEYITGKDWSLQNDEQRKILTCATTVFMKTPLHFASYFSWINPLRSLINIERCCNSDLNCRDIEGKTPLHTAVKVGNFDHVDCLLSAGALVHATTTKGKTPLHQATSSAVARRLLEDGANPFAKGNEGDSCFKLFVKYSPQCALEVLNQGIKTNDNDEDSTRLLLKYDLKIFQQISHAYDKNSKGREMSGLREMEKNDRAELLKHPLCQLFLSMKWRKVRKHFILMLLFYFVFALSLSIFCSGASYIQEKASFENATTNCNNRTTIGLTFNVRTEKMLRCLDFNDFWIHTTYITYFLTFILAITLLFTKLILMIYDFSTFIRETEHVLEMFMLLTTIVFLSLVTIDITLATKFGAVAVLLAWIQITLLLARFPSFGIYIYMANFVFTTIIMFFTLYLTALIGFAISFHMLLKSQKAFDDPISSLLKVIVMMIGEFDYDANFTNENNAKYFDLSHNDIAQIIFVFFILLVSIILANLIVGLTVNKTDTLFKQADYYHNSKKVLNICKIEDILEFKVFGRIKHLSHGFGLKGIQLLDELESKIYKKCSYVQPLSKTNNQYIDWEVCVFVNDENHRKTPWYRTISSAYASKEEISDFMIYIYNTLDSNYGRDTQANTLRRMYSTCHDVPYEIVHSTLERIREYKKSQCK